MLARPAISPLSSRTLAKKRRVFYGSIGNIAIGENSVRGRFGNEKLTTHAEMDALTKHKQLLRIGKCKKSKIDLIVIRVNRTGKLCESAPCVHCTKELQECGIPINKIYFSRNDGTITSVKFSEWIESDYAHVTKGWRWIQNGCNLIKKKV